MVLRNVKFLPEPDPNFTWLPLTQLIRDQRVNTRPVDPVWVDAHISKFDPDALGVITVSARPDGRYVVLDGQNRAELARRAIGADQSVPCRVLRNLSIPQEASLFDALNDGRRVKSVHRFLARVTAEEPAALAITMVVERAGWRIKDQTGERNITATTSLEAVYNGDRNKGDGHNIEALAKTLRTVTEAWGYKPEAVAGDLLKGLGLVFLRYGTDIDTASLVKRLASNPAGPSGIIGDARGLRQYQGGSVAHCVAEVVVALYNRRRKTHALPSWRNEATA